jgi:uncharacterized repeat protein (TIGR01451 family)
MASYVALEDFNMCKRVSVLIGATFLSAAVLLGLMWLMSPSFSFARSGPTRSEVNAPDLAAGVTRYRPTGEAATGRDIIDSRTFVSFPSDWQGKEHYVLPTVEYTGTAGVDTSPATLLEALLPAGNAQGDGARGSDGPLYITKTATSLARVGDDVVYDITVCNTSDSSLEKWSVTDSLIPSVDISFAPTLPAHTCETHSFTRTVQATDPDPLINTATATYNVEESSIIYVASDMHSLNLFSFDLNVTKTGDTLAQVGDDVNYSIEVCNVGDAALTRISVVDTLIPGVNGNFNATLPPATCETRNFVRTVLASDPYPWLTNTVTATYQVVGEPDVLTADDSHVVRLFTPGLSVAKTGDAIANIGDDVTYFITVCNTGDVALTRLSVVDSLIPGVDGDYGPTLAPAACEAHTFVRTVLASDPFPLLTNFVTATYQVQGASAVLVANDSHTVQLFTTGLAVIKAGDTLAQVGDDVNYSIEVCNTSSVAMDKVSVVDSLIPGVDAAYGASLAAGVCETHAFVRTVLASDPYPWLTNTVTATYQIGGQSAPLTATDSHTVRLIAPGLSIVKTGDALAQVGDNVDYSIQVCNTGDVVLNKVSVTDNLIPGVNDVYAASLSPGSCETHAFVRRVLPSDPFPWLTNTATAVYQVAGQPDILTVNDSHTVRLVDPSLDVTKTGDALSRVGEDVNYTIEVCNTGDVTLNKESVTDDLISGVNGAYGSALAPGACETHNFVRTVLPTDPHPLLTNTVTAIYRISGLAGTLRAADSHVVRLTTPNLDITKTGDAYSKVGADVTYPIEVCNTGYVTLTRLSVVDSLIPNVDGAYGPGLLPGACETRTFVRTVLPTDPDPLVNVVTATYQVLGGGDILVATDTHAVALPETDLIIQKTANPPQGPPNAPITFTITYINDSPNMAPNVVITDWLPAGTHYVADTSGLPCPACEAGSTGPLTWTIASLAPYANHSFNLHLRHDDPPCQGTLVNTAVITTVIFDTNPANNRATATYEIIPAVDLVVVKETYIGPGSPGEMVVYPGDYLTYTIAYTNNSPCPATNVMLTETLPEHTDYVGISWTHVADRTYTQHIGDVLPGQSGRATLVVQLHDSDTLPAGVGCINNTIYINSEDTEMEPTSDTSTVTTTIGSDWKLYVANRDSGTLDVFNTTTFAYQHTITLTTEDGRRGAPFGMAITGTRLFVADFGTDTDPTMRSPLYVVDTVSDTVIHRSPVGRHAIHVAAYRDRVYVADHSTSLEGITIVNANEPYDVVERLECTDDGRCFGYGFFGVTVDEQRERLYFTKRDNYYFGVWVLTPTVNGPELDYVSTGGHPTSALYNPNEDRLYVTFGLLDQLWVFDPNDGLAVVEKIATGYQDPVNPGYGGHGLASRGECIFVSNYKGESLTAVLNGECVNKPDISTDITVTNSHIYTTHLPLVMSNFAGSGPTLVNIPLSGRPKGMAVAGNLLFVTLPVDGNEQPLNKVAVVDLRTLSVVHEITVRGEHPHTVILARNGTDKDDEGDRAKLVTPSLVTRPRR